LAEDIRLPTYTLFHLITTSKGSVVNVTVREMPHFGKEMENGAKYGELTVIKL
jgi:hypothetical protein